MNKSLEKLARDPRVDSVLDEGGSRGDGYWVWLKPGWVSEWGSRTVHEPTIRGLLHSMRRVEPDESGNGNLPRATLSMTRGRKELVADALDAGLRVGTSVVGTGVVIVRDSVSVVIWDNGDLTRGDVRLDLAKRMTLGEARALLFGRVSR